MATGFAKGKMVTVLSIDGGGIRGIILTKAVSTRNFYDSLDKLGIRDIYAPT